MFLRHLHDHHKYFCKGNSGLEVLSGLSEKHQCFCKGKRSSDSENMNSTLCISMSYLFWKEHLPETSKRIRCYLVSLLGWPRILANYCSCLVCHWELNEYVSGKSCVCFGTFSFLKHVKQNKYKYSNLSPLLSLCFDLLQLYHLSAADSGKYLLCRLTVEWRGE